MSLDEVIPVSPDPEPEDYPGLTTRIATSRYLYWAAVALVMALFLAVCLNGVANCWQWGHNGFNGAAFSQAARNSLRFHTVGQALYYTDVVFPGPEYFYTHHPLNLHFHLTVLFRFLGDAEWVGRLVPAAYSFLGLIMLFVAVKRYYGKAVALGSIIAYALIPLNLIFANMINHEQGSIFWCLFFLYMYLRWMESGGVRRLLLVLLGVTMAVQFDWPGYYLAFFIAVHAFVRGLRSSSDRRWKREYTFAAVFSAVVLLNFILFSWFIINLSGGFDDMIAAFRDRTAHPIGVFQRLWHRSLDLQGPLMILVLAAWPIVYFRRRSKGMAHPGDLIPLFFLLCQTIHTLLFREAGFYHSYWTYHLSPGLAVMAASLVLGAAGALWRWAKEHEGTMVRRLAVAGAISVVIVPLVCQASFACRQLEWGWRTGTASYVEPYDDQYLQVRWIQHLTRERNRTNSRFVVDKSLEARIELIYYLDAPLGRLGTDPDEKAREPRHRVYLFDLDRMSSHSLAASLAGRHHSIVYDGRFLVVDKGEPTEAMEGYRHEELDPSLVWRWLNNPVRPPIRWRRDEDLATVRRLLKLDEAP